MGSGASFVNWAKKAVVFAGVAAFSSQAVLIEILINCETKGCAAKSTRRAKELQPTNGEAAPTGTSVLCFETNSNPSGIISKVAF